MPLSFHRRTASLLRHGPAHFATFDAAGLLFPALPAGTKTMRFWLRKLPSAGRNEYLFDNRGDGGDHAYALSYGVNGCAVYANGGRVYGDNGQFPGLFTNEWVDCVITMFGDMHKPGLLGNSEGYANALSASVADLRVYAAESTPTEIASGNFPGPLVARYDFRSMSDTVITDISGNGYPLAIIGTAGIQHDQ